jgi:hypothetical protein
MHRLTRDEARDHSSRLLNCVSTIPCPEPWGSNEKAGLHIGDCRRDSMAGD